MRLDVAAAALLMLAVPGIGAAAKFIDAPPLARGAKSAVAAPITATTCMASGACEKSTALRPIM